MLEWATDYFEKKKIPSPRLSIEWLLAHVLESKRLDLYLQFDRPLSREELDRLKPLVLRRADNEPLQYITGYTDFYNITLHVNRSVLIPRPETEQLVDIILQAHTDDQPCKVLDIGTGSGCIALALKKARPSWQITGIDISVDALETARQNAVDLELDATFLHADLESYLPDSLFNIIVSNPPYITKEDIPELTDQVYLHEPEIALVADDVPSVYRSLITLCNHSLIPTGTFYLEINEVHGDKLLKICNKDPFRCRLLKDYSGKDRFIKGNFN